MLIRSQVMYKKRKEKEKGNETLKQLMKSTDNNEVIELLRKHTREELVKIIEFTEENFERTVTSFLHENLRGLRRAMGSVKFEKTTHQADEAYRNTCHVPSRQQYRTRKKDSITIKATTLPANWCTA